MRSLAEQSHYEVIEAPLDGTPQQIERAYRIARSTYQPSSAATYSLFSAEDSAAILRRIDEAYAVLSDARLRREYDARLGGSEPLFAKRPDGSPASLCSHGNITAGPAAPRPSTACLGTENNSSPAR